MNLKRYNKETISTRGAVSSKATMRMNSYGQIAISPATITLLKLKEGDAIEVIQNKDAPCEWFITASKADVGFVLKKDKSGQSLRFQSTALFKAVIKSMEIDLGGITVRVGTEPVMIENELLYPLITPSYKEFLRKDAA